MFSSEVIVFLSTVPLFSTSGSTVYSLPLHSAVSQSTVGMLVYIIL